MRDFLSQVMTCLALYPTPHRKTLSVYHNPYLPLHEVEHQSQYHFRGTVISYAFFSNSLAINSSVIDVRYNTNTDFYSNTTINFKYTCIVVSTCTF